MERLEQPVLHIKYMHQEEQETEQELRHIEQAQEIRMRIWQIVIQKMEQVAY